MQEIKVSTSYRVSLRERIMEVAIKAFSQRGIRAVKMDDIAKELGISKRTLYEIYDNKALLLYESMKKYKQQHDEEMKQRAQQSNSVISYILEVYRLEVERFHQINPAFYADIEKYPQVVKFLEEEKKEHRQTARAFMERGVKEGYFRREVNYELIVCVFDALSAYLPKNELFQKYSMEELFLNVVFVTIRGICTLKGIEELDRAFKQ